MEPRDPAFRAPLEPRQIGPYRILHVLGEGGMGTVYLAEQRDPVERRVALKVVRAAALAGGEFHLRFEAERRALARLSHPNVAQLYEAGTTPEGHPYFAMEAVEGSHLTTFCDDRKLSVRARLQLFLDVCAGVTHAHQKGLVHRDLKPSNVLVTEVGGRPLAKIIDFGIAKALDQPLVPAGPTVGIIGTPGYLSPEALAALQGMTETDTRTDVYALGILLFELLAGTLPFGAELPPVELLRRIRDEEPPRPTSRLTELRAEQLDEIAACRSTTRRSLSQQLAGDLDWIVRKAIARDREQRYGSVASLAADIERHLALQPVEAGPPSVWYRAGKLVRRRRGAVAAAVLLAIALLGGFVARSLEATRASRAAAEAERARLAAEAARGETEKVADFLVGLFGEASPEQNRGQQVTARELLDRGAERIRGELQETPLVRARLLQTMAGVYQRLGLFREAKPLVSEALELRERELGKDDLLVAQSLRLLAIVAVELGDRDHAGELFRRVIAIREAKLGPDHPEVGDSLGNLGFFLMQQGRFDEARPMLERALAIRRKTLGENHPRLAPTLYNLALLHQTTGHPELAEPLYRQALAIETEAYGEDHPAIAQGLYGLGDLYREMGRFEDAESHLRRALSRYEKLFGAENIETAYIHLSLGKLAFARGRLDEAASELQRVRAIQALSLPAGHPDRVSVDAELTKVEAAQRAAR